jgi:hypothetical protein
MLFLVLHRHMGLSRPSKRACQTWVSASGIAKGLWPQGESMDAGFFATVAPPGGSAGLCRPNLDVACVIESRLAASCWGASTESARCVVLLGREPPSTLRAELLTRIRTGMTGMGGNRTPL